MTESDDFLLAPAALCVTRERLIVRCNTVFAELFGYDTSELVGNRSAGSTRRRRSSSAPASAAIRACGATAATKTSA